MNKQQLQQEIADLQKQLEEKQKALSAMPDKWEPKVGEWFVDLFGEVVENGLAFANDFGCVYHTREQAEKAAKAMRAHNRLLAYVAEFAPDYDHKFLGGRECDYCIAYSHSDRCYKVYQSLHHHFIGAVYMTFDAATELKRKLNSGEVQL